VRCAALRDRRSAGRNVERYTRFDVNVRSAGVRTCRYHRGIDMRTDDLDHRAVHARAVDQDIADVNQRMHCCGKQQQDGEKVSHGGDRVTRTGAAEATKLKIEN